MEPLSAWSQHGQWLNGVDASLTNALAIFSYDFAQKHFGVISQLFWSPKYTILTFFVPVSITVSTHECWLLLPKGRFRL